MIRFACPACKSVLESPDHKAGHKIACPKCGQRLQIPSPVRNRDRTVLGQSLPAKPVAIPVKPSEAPRPSAGKRKRSWVRIALSAVWVLSLVGAVILVGAVVWIRNNPNAGRVTPGNGKDAVLPPAKVVVTWPPLAEAERARWNKIRAKARQEFVETRKNNGNGDLLPLPFGGEAATDEETKKHREAAERAAEEAKAKAAKEWDEGCGHHLQYLVYDPRKKEWQSASIANRSSRRNSLPRREVIGSPYAVGFQCETDDAVRERAPQLAAETDVQYVAVMDLFTAEDPILVSLVQDDGSGKGARWDAQPTREILEQLKKFVHHLRTSAD